MTPHLRYAWYLIRHKWFVFVAGRRVGVPLWALLIHDWSKLTRAEWGPYVRSFYGPQPRTSQIKQEFDKAWLHHQHHNPHHWQHWVLRKDDGGTKCLPMPARFVREMVADWAGAGRTITGKWEVSSWYRANRDKMELHPDTRDHVELLLTLALFPS